MNRRAFFATLSGLLGGFVASLLALLRTERAFAAAQRITVSVVDELPKPRVYFDPGPPPTAWIVPGCDGPIEIGSEGTFDTSPWLYAQSVTLPPGTVDLSSVWLDGEEVEVVTPPKQLARLSIPLDNPLAR